MFSAINFNFFNLFIISASIHGLIFGMVVLYSKKINSKPNKYLAYYILLVSLNNIYFWFFDTNIVLNYNWKYFWLFPIQWDLLMFPALIYFVYNFLSIKTIPKFFLYPFFLSFPILTFFFIERIYFPNFIDSSGFFYKYFRIVSSFVSMLFSGIAIYHAFKIINKYKKNNASLKIETKWLERLLFLMILVLFLWISIFTYNSLFTGKTNERTTTYLLWISMSLLTYRMGYLGIYHLGIFNQREAIRKGLIKEDIENKQSLNTLKGAHNSSNRFTEIDAYINKNKSYLDSNLTLTSLSEIFNLSEGYLSQLINTNTGINFSTYINQLRIEESKILLTNPAYKNYTIIAVALESGFNSKSVFYVAFKKQEGISPSEFKKTAKNLS